MSWRVLAGVACVTALFVTGCDGSADKLPASSPPSFASQSSPVVSLTPVPRIFDQGALEDGVRRVLVQSYRLSDVGTVHCPSGQAVQVGSSFDCTVQIGGTTKNVTLTVRGVDGTYEVSQPK